MSTLKNKVDRDLVEKAMVSSLKIFNQKNKPDILVLTLLLNSMLKYSLKNIKKLSKKTPIPKTIAELEKLYQNIPKLKKNKNKNKIKKGGSNSSVTTEELELVRVDNNLNAFDQTNINGGFQLEAMRLELEDKRDERARAFQNKRDERAFQLAKIKLDHENRQIFNDYIYELINSVIPRAIVAASAGTVVYILNNAVGEIVSVTGKGIGNLGGFGFGTAAASIGKAYTGLVNTQIMVCELKNKVKWTPDKCDEPIDSISFMNKIDEYTERFMDNIFDTTDAIGDSSSIMLANVILFIILLFVLSGLWCFVRFATQSTKISVLGFSVEIGNNGRRTRRNSTNTSRAITNERTRRNRPRTSRAIRNRNN